MGEYLNALLREITAVGTYLSNKGWYPESIYVGGGTPTILSAGEMRALLTCIENNLDMTQIKEITVEAGRPDTIDREKLEGLKEAGVERISINPQSMKSDTLDLIGRNHEPETIIEAYKIARNTGFPIINMDLIAGLPGEKLCDFQSSLNRILDLHPENITIHTLAVKRASKLKTIDAEYSYRQGELVKEMLDYGQDILKKSGYSPYYLYRQKQMTGNLENVGYALPGTESIYNIRIMEENQNIIAMGAGGISKFIYPEENRLERIPNVSNYEIYIERIDEMINRKLKHIQ